MTVLACCAGERAPDELPHLSAGQADGLGCRGSEPDSIAWASSLCFDPAGEHLYVADAKLHRVQRFSAPTLKLLCAVGTNGTALGQFAAPCGLHMPASGKELYVVDHGNNRVQVLDPETLQPRRCLSVPGQPLACALSGRNLYVLAEDRNSACVLVLAPGTGKLRDTMRPEHVPSTEPLLLHAAHMIVDPAGHLLISHGQSVTKMSGEGQVLWTVELDEAAGKFSAAGPLAASPSSLLVVADVLSSQVAVLGSDGTIKFHMQCVTKVTAVAFKPDSKRELWFGRDREQPLARCLVR